MRQFSINRAIKRGTAMFDGSIAPKRPFNNKANTSERKGIHSRTLNERKKSIYFALKTQWQKKALKNSEKSID